MWCPACQQHVAAIVGDSGDCTLCAVCGFEIDVFADLAAVGTAVSPSAARRTTKTTPEAALPHLSHSRARLDHIGRRLEALAIHAPAASRRQATPLQPHDSSSPAQAPNWIAAAGLFTGIAALVCGVSLAAWSLASGRAELWNIGLPTAIVGQCLLLAALAAQSDFWRSTPATARGENR